MYIEKEDMEKILRKVPGDEPNLDDWIREECVALSYIIYNSKEDTAVCTRCGSMNLNGRYYTGLHGEKAKCPMCGEEVTVLSEGRGRKNCSEFFRLLTWTPKGRTVYGRLYEIEASFVEPGLPQLHKWLSALYIVNSEEQSYYKHKPGDCWRKETWEKYKTFRVPAPPGGMGYCWTTKFTFTFMKVEGLESVFKKTDLKYLWIPGWCDNMPPDEMVRYIGYGMRQPSMELMTKAGFTRLVTDRIKGERSGHIVNWQGKSLERILRLPKRNVRKLQQLNPSTKEVKIFRAMTEEEQDIMHPDTIRAVAAYVGYGDIERFRKKIEKLVPFQKWLKYIDRQVTDRTGIAEWFDYINACEKLGKDVHKNRILLPEDLKEAHDRMIAELVAKEDADKTEAIRAAARCEEFTKGLMVMLPADTQEKLNIESAILHHCVRTYGDRIAKGKCWIWFIRKTNDRDTPFYTLETDTDGHMRQCRGLHNCSMTEDVERFVNQFTTHLQKEIKKERASA